jgi:hypothetical protein
MQYRSEEKQASDAVFEGKITLYDGTIIDFNKKTTHNITPAYKWNNASGTPLDDIADACDLCVQDGKISSATFNLVIADNALNALLTNPQFLAQAKAMENINRANISIPVENLNGVKYHGQFSAKSYKINLFTYPQYYEIPTGFEFANEGEVSRYIPEGRALLFPDGIRFDMFHGGVESVPVGKASGDIYSIVLPELEEVEQLPYAYTKVESGELWTEAGVKSRPLFIPTNIDGFATFNALV